MVKHDDHDMGGDPRKSKTPRNPRSAKDRQHLKGAGQSQKSQTEVLARHEVGTWRDMMTTLRRSE